MIATALEPILLDVDLNIEEYELDIEEVIETIQGDMYDGLYTVVPKAAESTILETRNKTMRDNVTVLEIPYAEVSNPIGGKTAIIGGI